MEIADLEIEEVLDDPDELDELEDDDDRDELFAKYQPFTQVRALATLSDAIRSGAPRGSVTRGICHDFVIVGETPGGAPTPRPGC